MTTMASEALLLSNFGSVLAKADAERVSNGGFLASDTSYAQATKFSETLAKDQIT
jgi:hypothetical protein